jgi:HEAT repeat protein
MSVILSLVSDDPATEPVGVRRAAADRRRRVILAGHTGNLEQAKRGWRDPDSEVRAASLGALARLGSLRVPDIAEALATSDALVRRRATDAALSVRGAGSRSALFTLLVNALGDEDPLVVVGATWFLGERRVPAAVGPLSEVAEHHDDIRCREGAVAALGAIGDVAGLDAVIAALNDKPTIRRRATVALAGFDDPRVEPALQKSAEDRDWQVRQAADELLDEE